MAKQSGLGDALYIRGVDISGDASALGRIGGGPAALNLTGIRQEAFERQGGVRDGGIDFTTFFNDATDAEHDVLSDLPTSNALITYCRGTQLGSPAASMIAKQVNYDGSRTQDGMFTLSVNALSAQYGLEWGRLLTAGSRLDTAATNGSSVDLGSASPGAFGMQFYVHLLFFTGTNITIKVQESSDNGAGDAWADVVGATSGALTARFAGRFATAAINVERYIRVVTTGTFSSATFMAMAVRNDTAVTF